MTTAGDLPDLMGAPNPRPFLYCFDCCAEYSAHRGDYFLLNDSDVINCECGSDLDLAVRECRLVRV